MGNKRQVYVSGDVAMLKLKGIEVMYAGGVMVLKNVSLEVSNGSVVALLGANGAGKTTTLRAISGLLEVEEGEVTEGSIEIDGEAIQKMHPEEIAAMGIVQVLEGRRVLEQLNTEENLIIGAFSRRDRSNIKGDLEMVYDYFPRLKNLRRRTSGYLSGGEQQMLVIGSALLAHPKLMLLDEPSLGLAPLVVTEIYATIEKIHSEEKSAILLVEQNAIAALSIASYGYIMETGRVVLEGSSEKLSDNEDVKEFYLGLNEVGKKKSFRDVKHYRRRKRWLG